MTKTEKAWRRFALRSPREVEALFVTLVGTLSRDPKVREVAAFGSAELASNDEGSASVVLLAVPGLVLVALVVAFMAQVLGALSVR